jgi:hypothetical protein
MYLIYLLLSIWIAKLCILIVFASGIRVKILGSSRSYLILIVAQSSDRKILRTAKTTRLYSRVIGRIGMDGWRTIESTLRVISISQEKSPGIVVVILY